jgi:transcription initiation factor IIF auxiliary subunit
VENNAINNPIPSKKSSREGAHPFSLQLEQEELDRIIAAQKEVDEQIEEMKARIASADEELAQLKKEGYV